MKRSQTYRIAKFCKDSCLAGIVGIALWLSISVEAWATYGSSIKGARLGQQWQATDVQGKVVSPVDMRGKVTVYFFGFTHCPDICPTSLLNLSDMLNYLTLEQRQQVQVVFISVDPERDTPELLQHYLNAFEGDFIGLTGSVTQIKNLASSFKVHYRKVPFKNSADYTMDHSSQLYVFDKEGKPQLLYYSDVEAEKLATDIISLLQ